MSHSTALPPTDSIDNTEKPHLEDDGSKGVAKDAHGKQKRRHRKTIPCAPCDYPSPSEVEQTENDIRIGIATLAEIDATITRKRVEIEELETRRKELEADINRKKASISRLRLIPDEVLSIIFEGYMDCWRGPDPWVLMHVCRQWRVAATHTRSIWSKIMLATSNIANERRQDGYEFCHSVALLRNALARAGEGPIDLYCKFGRFSCSIPQRDYWATPQQMVDVLRETGAHHRIRFLEMRKPSSETIEEVEKIDLSGFQLLTLKETILNWSFQGLNECIQKTAPQLRRLYIARTYDNAQYDWDLSKLISLSDLELAKKADSGLEAVRMISSAPNLVKLSLTSVAIEPPTGEPVSVPTLRELRLQYTRIKCKVMFPGLRILSIDKSTLLTSASQPLILPSLALLELVELKADECPHIHARSLQKLEMCSFTRSVRILERLFELTILPGHLRTRSIRLHSAYVDSEALADVLDQMPGLVEIHLGNKFPVDKPFFEELAGYSLHSSSISDPREPICTSLETIKLDTSWIPRLATKLAMIKWLRKAVDARAKGPFPLKEALLKEEYNEPWVSLL